MSSPVDPFVLDSGALIALERAALAMTGLLMRVRAGQARLVVPDGVVAQVWRDGTGRQARVLALLGLKPEWCVTVPLDTAAAKHIGFSIEECGPADVVDVHVALVARGSGSGGEYLEVLGAGDEGAVGCHVQHAFPAVHVRCPGQQLVERVGCRSRP